MSEAKRVSEPMPDFMTRVPVTKLSVILPEVAVQFELLRTRLVGANERVAHLREDLDGAKTEDERLRLIREMLAAQVSPRKIAKGLHPDTSPDVDPQYIALFNRIQEERNPKAA